MAERSAKREGGGEIDADDDAGLRCEAQLTGAAKDHIPGLPASVRQRFVRVIGAVFTVNAGVTVGARPALRRTPFAIPWPAAEVPFGAGLQSFFSSSSSSAGLR